MPVATVLRWSAVLLLCAAWSGCASSNDGDETPGNTPCVSGAPGCVAAPAAPGGQMPAGPVTDGVPCNVATIVTQNCGTCHSERPKFNAPMPLTKLSHFQAASPTMPARKVYEVAIERINAVDIRQRMPPASGSAIAGADLEVMNTWLQSGALAGPTSCAVMDPSAPPTTTGGAAGMGGPTTMGTGGAPNNPVAGSPAMPPPAMEGDVTCHEFRAHAPGSKTTPFSVPNRPDMYTNFTFMGAWPGMQYARSLNILIDNVDVIHHYLLYKNSTAGPDGAVDPSIGAHPNGELVHGWAPGAESLVLNADVGIEMPGTVSYTLETHHNNLGSGPAPDASGIEVCVTPTVPANIASLSWLGSDQILNTTSAQGTCNPTSNERIRLIGATPHMHTKGIHMKAVLNRAAGGQEILHDQPFDFNFQRAYMFDELWMEPGDTISTTCSYSSPVSFGEGTGDEMCYFFVLHFPKLALTQPGIGQIIHGPNSCL